MQGLEIEAIYEHGTLKLPRELPLIEGATVTITIHPPKRPGMIKHLRIPWTGSLEEFDRWLNEPDEGQWGGMTFNDILSGAAVFLDAICLICAFVNDPRYGSECQRLLKRVDNQDIQGFTSAQDMSEMAHRVMTLEASKRFNRSLAGITNWLRRHPNEVQQLSRHRQAIDEVIVNKVQVLPVEGAEVSRAADFSIACGLLSSDALIVTVMQRHGLFHLASNDPDFDRVPGLTRYAPV